MAELTLGRRAGATGRLVTAGFVTALWFCAVVGRAEDRAGTAAAGVPAPLPPEAMAAYDFLAAQMDEFHQAFTVYDDHDSGAAHFFPSGFMGDFVGLPKEVARRVVDGNCADRPWRGSTCLRLTYPAEAAREGGAGWAGVYFQVGRWGDLPGYDLRRYCRADEPVTLTFAARGRTGGATVEFKAGGITGGRFRDSFGPVTTTDVPVLTDRWQSFSIDLSGHDLRRAIGGFCVVFSRRGGECVVDIDDVLITFGPAGRRARLGEPRFIRSYVPPLPDGPDKYFRNACYTYDQALTILAFLARGTEDDLRRAGLLADALVYAQNHDRHFTDGRLRNAYSCGDLADTAGGGAARLPGWWDAPHERWIEDRYFAGSDCGNLGWAMLALTAYWERCDRRADSPYLLAAERLGEWIHRNAHSPSGHGGYTGGLEGWEPGGSDDGCGAGGVAAGGVQTKVAWTSTEHNLDLAVAFMRLARAREEFPARGRHGAEVDWQARSRHARQFCERMWDGRRGHFRTGANPDGTVNTNVVLDCQSWGVLATRDPRYDPALDWALQHCRVPTRATDARGGPALGFDFDTDRDGCWSEGTGQMAVAFGQAGRPAEAERCLATLRRAVATAQPRGGLPAADVEQLTTGFTKEFGQWLYFRRPAVGSVCWYLFGELQWNPYHAEPVGRR